MFHVPKLLDEEEIRFEIDSNILIKFEFASISSVKNITVFDFKNNHLNEQNLKLLT